MLHVEHLPVQICSIWKQTKMQKNTMSCVAKYAMYNIKHQCMFKVWKICKRERSEKDYTWYLALDEHAEIYYVLIN